MSALVDKWTIEGTEMQQTLGDLEVGRLHIEKPWEGRNAAKLTELRRKIANRNQLIEIENARA